MLLKLDNIWEISASWCRTLQEEKYQELADCFKSQKIMIEQDLNWHHCGPPNKRSV